MEQHLFRIGEVAKIVGKTPQTIKVWEEISDELEKQGKPRLIPKSIRLGAQQIRYWTPEDVEKIKEVSERIKWGTRKNFIQTGKFIEPPYYLYELSSKYQKSKKGE